MELEDEHHLLSGIPKFYTIFGNFLVGIPKSRDWTFWSGLTSLTLTCYGAKSKELLNSAKPAPVNSGQQVEALSIRAYDISATQILSYYEIWIHILWRWTDRCSGSRDQTRPDSLKYITTKCAYSWYKRVIEKNNFAVKRNYMRALKKDVRKYRSFLTDIFCGHPSWMILKSITIYHDLEIFPIKI